MAWKKTKPEPANKNLFFERYDTKVPDFGGEYLAYLVFPKRFYY